MKLTSNDTPVIVIAIMFIIGILCGIGWFMNFQNLFQYWPDAGGIAAAPLYWWLSAVGIFVAPLGVFMGWFF